MSGSTRASSLASKRKGSREKNVSLGTGPLNRHWNKTREQFNSSNKRSFRKQIPECAGWW